MLARSGALVAAGLLLLVACDGAKGDSGAGSCAALDAEMRAETERITTCERDEDCGRGVEGTSCQSECDLVARLDADVTTLEALVQDSAMRQCSFPFDRPCDCPTPVGAVCTDAGVCEWDWGR
jgi:hypothetical protein